MDSSPAFGLCEKFTVWSKLTKRRFFLIGCMTIEPVILHQSSRRKKMYINFDSILVGMLCQFLPWFKYTLCFYLCTQLLSYLPPFVLSHLLCFFPNKEIPKNNCCDNNSFTTRLIILRKVSLKLPVFQSILEMLVFYRSENTGLVSMGYSEQI